MLFEVTIPGDGYRQETLVVPVLALWYPDEEWWLSLADFEEAFEILEAHEGPKAIYTNARVPDWGPDSCTRKGIALLKGKRYKYDWKRSVAALEIATRRLFGPPGIL